MRRLLWKHPRAAWVVLVAFGIFPLGALAAAQQQLSPKPQFGGIYRRPLAQAPSTLDPAKINDIYGRTIAEQIFGGLVRFDSALTIKPGIAKSWRSSRDGLVWTFTLRRGVRFHNGREVTADDFIYSLTRILNPKTNSGAQSLFLNIDGAKEYIARKSETVRGIKAPDRYTLQISLVDSSGPFVSTLAIGAAKVVPREIVDGAGADSFGKRPIGTGPFRLVQWDEQQIVLEANPHYYEGRPFLDRVVYRIFAGDPIEKMFAAFTSGELEDAPFPSDAREKLIRSQDYLFIRRPILGIRFLAMNTASPPLDDVRVRKAITHAIDRKWIAEHIYNGRYLPGVGILPPGTYGYDPKLAGLEYDPNRSRELLAQAGYSTSRPLPTLHIWSAAKFEEAVAELEKIVEYLAAVQIKAIVHFNTNWPVFKRSAYAGEFPMFRYSWYADSPEPSSFLELLLHSKAPHNLPRYHNARVDSLLEQGKAEVDYFKRVSTYKTAERILVQEAPMLVLGYYSYERVFQPYVHGIDVSALGDRYIPMNKIWLAPPVK
ncbi:MAG: ABC transporter substrate-binding protein [Candidatus Binatia bacterium]